MDIFDAVKQGKEEEVSRLVDADPTLLEKLEHGLGDTPLAQAAQAGQLGVVKLLVRRGANVNAVMGRWKLSALHHAARLGHEEVVTCLLKEGAHASGRTRCGRTALMWAAIWGHMGVVRLLVQHMREQGLEGTDDEQSTALHYAVQHGHADVVAFLSKQGAQASRTDAQGRAPLTLKLACEGGHRGVVQALVRCRQEEGREVTDDELMAALHLAVVAGREELVDLLLSRTQGRNVQADGGDRAWQGMTLLMVACEKGHMGVAQMLLGRMAGQGLEATDPRHGRSALHFAAAGGREELIRALLLAGADPTARDRQGRTPRDIAMGMCEEYAKAFDWWEAELERRYALQRARTLHDAYMVNQAHCMIGLPACLEGRVEAGKALPQVEVAAGQSEGRQQQAGASGKREASSEAGVSGSAEKKRHAVLGYVVTQLDSALFIELINCFHAPRSDGEGAYL